MGNRYLECAPLGSKQQRAIQKRLDRHAALMEQFQREGMTREAASRKAFQMVKAGATPAKARGGQ